MKGLARTLLAQGVQSIASVPAYDPSTVYAANRLVTSGGKLWKSTATVPRAMPPAGVGDGSTADRDLLISQMGGFALDAGTTGGYSGATYTVTTTADSGAGSYRAAMESATTYWVIFDKTVFPPGTETAINLTATLTPLPNKTVDGRGAGVAILNAQQHLVQGIGNPTVSGSSFIRYPNGVANMIFSHVRFDTTSVNLNRDCFTMTYGCDKVWFNHCAFTGGTDGTIDISQPDDGGVDSLYGSPNSIKTRVHFTWPKFGPHPTNANLAEQGALTGGDNLPENGKTNLWGLSGDTPDKLFISVDHGLWDGTVQRNPKYWYGAHGHMWNCVVKRWSLVPGVVVNTTQQAAYSALGKTSVIATYGTIGTQVEQNGQLLVEGSVYQAYATGDPHVLDATWQVLYPDTDGIGVLTGGNLKTNDILLLNGATKSADTGAVTSPPYAYAALAGDSTLKAEVESYAGNYQPWVQA